MYAIRSYYEEELKIMSDNALEFFKQNYEREMLLDKMDKYLNN